MNDSSGRVTNYDNKVTVSMDPPDYEQSEKSRKTAIQNNHPGGTERHPSRDTYHPAPPTYNGNQTEPVAVAVGHLQAEIAGKTGVPSREETEEDKKERKRQQLERRRVPPELWDYYLESPELWNFADLSEDGLQKGINAILIAPHTVVPCWVENDSINKFVELKLKMTTLVQTLTEIKKFTEEPMPEDNQLAAERKQAQKRSDKLQADLISSCNDLTALTVVPENCFGKIFMTISLCS